MRFIYYLFLCLCLYAPQVAAQGFVYARLGGSPLNTANWNLAGAAYVGDTQGDPDSNADELILTNPINFTSGAVFFREPLNVGECQRWTAEFDYRIWDGTAADGIAFCFLANPPAGFVAGGGVGIPQNPRGLMVVLDTWLNCPATTPVPKLQIRFSNGSSNYSECPNPAQPTSTTLPILRQSVYNRMRIEYNNGDIRIFINNDATPTLTGNFLITFPGYFGFTAATGGSTDRHSIKNFTLRTFNTIAARANAGPDRSICSGQSAQLGEAPTPGDRYVYSWSPATGLDNPNTPNPRVTLTNNTLQDQRFSYFVTKDSLGNDTLCAKVDEVMITVRGRGADAGPDQLICADQPYQNTFNGREGFAYQWAALDGAPLAALSSSTAPNPVFRFANNTGNLLAYRYVLTARNAATGCTDADTVQFRIQPRAIAPTGIKTVRVCAPALVPLGVPPVEGFRYTWTVNGQPTPTVTSSQSFGFGNDAIPADSLRWVWVLTARRDNCVYQDTTIVIGYRSAFNANAGPDRQVCAAQPTRLGAEAENGVNYTWSALGNAPLSALSAINVANPLFTLANTGNAPLVLRYVLAVARPQVPCSRTDTVQVTVLPGQLPNTGRRSLRLCAGQSARIGVENLPTGFNALWTPTEGLGNVGAANTLYTAPNIQTDSANFRYVLTISNGLCSTRDTTDITVYRAPQANAGPDRQVCSNDTLRLGQAAAPNTAYVWTVLGNAPLSALSATNVANPLFRLRHTGNAPLVLRYVLTASQANRPCPRADTVQITVAAGELPPPNRRSLRLCAGQSAVLGPPDRNPLFSYRWSPAAQLTADTLHNPRYTAPNIQTDSATFRYVLTIGNGTCSVRDTTDITVYRTPQANAGPDRQVCAGETLRLGAPAVQGLTYTWTALGNASLADLSANNVAEPTFRSAYTGNAPLLLRYVLRTANRQGCTSADTVAITVQPRVENLGIDIEGPAQMCANGAATYRANFPTGFLYRWEVQGGQIAEGQGTSTVRVVWGNAGTGRLLLTPSTPNGCTGETLNLGVSVQPLPLPSIASADSVLCRQNLRALSYRVAGLPNSRFAWSIRGGRIATASPDSALITVDWDTLNFPKQLAVLERSAANCTASAALQVPLYYDATAIVLRRVSVQENELRTIGISFRITGAPALPQTFTVQRREVNGNWADVGNVRPTDTLFLDRNVNTANISYQYRLVRSQQAGNCPTATPAPHASIVLRGEQTANSIALAWNAYEAWPQVARYEIWRQLEGGNYALLASLPPDQLRYNGADPKAGFGHCYRVRAVRAGTGEVSWSAEWCATFAHPLSVPNVITPNNDGRNDRWVINALELYPDHELQVYDRWGQLLWQSRAYRNDWDGGQLPSGTYFYLLRARRPNTDSTQEIKGWLQIMRD